MDGYYIRDEKGKGTEVPTGTLRISVTNIQEFNELITTAIKEADALMETLRRLKAFDLRIDFDDGGRATQDSSESVFRR